MLAPHLALARSIEVVKMLQANAYFPMARTLMRHTGGKVRLLSSSSSSGLLIDEDSYQWLRDLGLHSQTPGVFDGVWRGSGPV